MTDQPSATPGAAWAVPRGALRSLTSTAVALLQHGQRQHALAVLRAALLDINPLTALPNPGVIDAATLYASVLHPHEGRDWLSLHWARSAHRSSRSLWDANHPRVIDATEILARTLAGYRLDGEAIEVRRTLHTDLSRRDGASAATTLAAHIELALVLHTTGHCRAAIRELTDANTIGAARYGPGHPDMVAALLQLAALLDRCGQYEEAARRTAQAFDAYHIRPSRSGPCLVRIPVHWIGEPDDGHTALCRRRESSPSTSASAIPRCQPD